MGVADPMSLLVELFEKAPVAFQIYQRNGHCLLVNQAFRELFGSEPPPEYNILEDEIAERQGLLPMVRRAFAGERIQIPAFWYDPRDHTRIEVKEGRRVAIEGTLFPLFDGDRQVAQVAITFKDVTARQELEAERAEWKSVFDHGPDFIARVDRDGVVRFINRVRPPRAREEVIGKPWTSLIPPRYHESLSRAFDAVMTTGQRSAHELMLPNIDGGHDWFSTHLGPIVTDGKITGAMVISREITQRKQQEAQLIVTDRMASIGTLAAGVAHEINNPLAAVIANLDLAHRRAVEEVERSGDHEMAEYLQDAQIAAERVRLIVRDLKIFSHAEEDRLGPIDVTSVLEATLRVAGNEIRHRARLVKDFGPVPKVEATEFRLSQVFLNLIVNATHAIPEGQSKRNEIKVSVKSTPEGTVSIEVTDTGSGMTEETQRRLFTPFFTTKPAGMGIGLGLSICQKLVAGMGGRILVRSALKEGSTFTVILPPAKATVAGPDAGAGSSVAAPRRRGRLLVIDDEQMIVAAVQRSLGKDHEVTYAHSAAQALARFREGQRFDVVLCDLMMPEMTGMDLHAELLELAPDQAERMIFVTGGAFTQRAREFLDTVPNLRIEKPFNVQQLRALVSERIR